MDSLKHLHDAAVVGIWRLDLAALSGHEEEFLGDLAPEERARALAISLASARAKFLVSRGVLRRLLGGLLGRRPQDVVLHYEPRGKPFLAGTSGAGDDVHFNVSHSGERALVALARGRAVGVDIEWMRPRPEALRLARRFFSPAEVAELQMLAPEECLRAFYRCWTRKESLVKASGKGIAGSLRQFSVSTADNAESIAVSFAPAWRDGAAWRVQSVDAGEGYCAAVAAEGDQWRPVVWDFRPHK